MRLDKLTIKLQEALQEAISFASESGHQQLEPEHLFYILLKQKESIVSLVLEKLGISISPIIKIIEKYLEEKPAVSAGDVNVYFSSRLNKLFHHAMSQAQILKDEFISAEHILLAIA